MGGLGGVDGVIVLAGAGLAAIGMGVFAGVPAIVSPCRVAVDRETGVVAAADADDEEVCGDVDDDGDIAIPVTHPPMDTIARPIIAMSGAARRRVVQA
jgi:hypothetical protein